MTSPSAPDPIHICGEALIDFVPVRTARGQNGYVPKPGGSPYNVAVAAARAGGAPRFVGEISTDFFGEMLHDHLVANRVDCRHVERSDRLSTLAFVDLSSGCPRYAFHNEGTTNQAMTPRIPHDGQRSILHVGSISLIPEGAGDRILELTRRHLPHGIVSLDPNVRSSLIGDRRNWLDRIRALCSHTSILKLSVEDIDYLSPESDAEAFAASAIADGIDMVIVTRDSEGAQAMTAEGAISVNVRPRHIHDTVGAGDTLTGAVLTWLAGRRINTRDAVRTLPPQSLETMLRFAVTAAALNCEAEGCDPPTRSMIEDRLTDVSRVTGTIRGRDADMHHHILSDSLQQTVLFDTHIFVDWSARSEPSPIKESADAIWWAVARSKDDISTCYARTRHCAMKRIRELIRNEINADRRVLIGFDFAFGYPKGVAGCLVKNATALDLWKWLATEIRDCSNNDNNRFEVASKMNEIINENGAGPFWGKPNNPKKDPKKEYPSIPSRKTECAGHQPPEFRITEEKAKGAKSVWQLSGAGVVGSQVLLGLPHLSRLIADSDFKEHTVVWPFETGLRLPKHEKKVVIVEIYPSLLREEIEKNRNEDEIRDRAQMRVTAEAFAGLDARGGLAPLFNGAEGLTDCQRKVIETEEGWILGLGHEESLREILR